MALVIAGEHSGVGKTTVTLTLLSFLSRQQRKVQSFKVGPDYIDPMFHQQVTGRLELPTEFLQRSQPFS